MPVQVNDTTTQIAYTVSNQTWVIAPDVNAGGGIQSNVTFSSLFNYGDILDTGVAAQFSANDVIIYNKAGALIAGSYGVNLTANNVELHNGGTIDGFSYGIVAGGVANNLTIENSGTVTGSIKGITLSSSVALAVEITNSGVIRGDTIGIDMSNAAGAAPVIVNTGTIRGGSYSILALSGDRLNVTNTGSLIGNVWGASANQADSITNNGKIAGNVLLASGNDLYKGIGTVSGWVFGEDGVDTLTGGNSVDRLDGGLGNDILTGNGGNDVLKGGNGNDALASGLGNDLIAGGLNNDFFVFNTAPNTATNRDTIVDFNHIADAFRMENAVFTELGAPGLLNPAFFRAGAAALDANDFIVYNQATGILSYDSNGNLAGGSVQVALLTTRPAVAFNDFAVI
jgi:Ca2+-binding RTX toxin-like protein